MPTSYGAPCDTRYRAVHHSGRRQEPCLWIVLHATQSLSAESAARWFTNPDSQGSAHLVIDSGACFRTLPNNLVAWGAPGANERGFHVEQAGYASWTMARWLRERAMLERAAWKVARHCHVFSIPPVFLGVPALRARRPWITTHANCSVAFGGDHTDPGRGWPRDLFMRLVRNAYRASAPFTS